MDAVDLKDRTHVGLLLELGFERAALWVPHGKLLAYRFAEDQKERLEALFAANNALYAFCKGETVLYIGKTTRTLKRRLRGYCRPGARQRTNRKCHELIKAELAQGREIAVLAFAPPNDRFFQGHEINLAAGLEDALIRTFSPSWNRQGKRAVSESEAVEAELSNEEPAAPNVPAEGMSVDKFQITLRPSYYKSGIVNPGKAVSSRFGPTGDVLTVRFSDGTPAITTRINRTANRSGAVRLVGGNAAIADWFQKHFEPGDQVTARILGPHQIEFLQGSLG